MTIVGHRGAKGLAPENTIASFKKALEYGVDEIELDVRVTQDGKTVLSHDTYVSDPAGNRLEVATTAFTELKKHKPDLATLEEALDYIDAKCPVVVEVKPEVQTTPVIDVLQQYLQSGMYSAPDLLLASYSQPVLRELHAALPEIKKVVIEDWSGVRAARRARELGTKRLSMLEIWLWSGFIRAMKRGGYELYCFPNKTPAKQRFFARFGLGNASNNPTKARRWAKAGLAGVITDFPDKFK